MKFSVQIKAPVYAKATVEVEAKTKEAAGDEALGMAFDGYLEWEIDQDDIESHRASVCTVEPLEPATGEHTNGAAATEKELEP